MSVSELVRVARDPALSIGRRHAAFALLVERFQAMALTVASEACGDVEGARDACQAAFLLAWRTLPRLRDPEAFGGWLKRLVRTQCVRARRDRKDPPEAMPAGPVVQPIERQETQRLLERALHALPVAERAAVRLVYFHGETLDAAARSLGVTAGGAGKLLYQARLRLRRLLPRELARTFLATRPSKAFTRKVEAGLLQELEGTYRFPERPDRPVIVRREGSALVARASGQRNVLTSRRAERLAPTEFDGEARLLRDRQGRITGFVYYEFGKRLGIAHRVAG